MKTDPLQHRAPLRVAVAQTQAMPGEVTHNVAEAARVVREAGERGVRVLLFPELSLTGYEPGWLRASLPEKAVDPYGTELDAIRDASRDSGVTAIVGAPTAHGKRSAISALVIDSQGETAAVGHKQHLEVHEREIFSPGAGTCTVTVDGWRLAVGICYDASFPEHVRAAALAGADAYLCGGAFVQGESDHRRSVYFPARALENTMYVLFANFVGQQGPWNFCGRSAVYGPDGRPLVEAGNRVPEIAIADLDVVALAEVREQLTMLQDIGEKVSPEPAISNKSVRYAHSATCAV
ncbi:carbon-nitrogen hydrolase family protein [Streptomyces violens]|uniref:carbon-nitrogen hydrolase family protein n=1 Tax=Streptomyces violens TaxID=66377 RepID=UPI0012FEAD64|nr:carbon-nitrogen hydrolase family protein [Streptomyces violens]